MAIAKYPNPLALSGKSVNLPYQSGGNPS